MSDPQVILHIGGPKCGSSALQSALSAAPDHGAYRYVAARMHRGALRPLRGFLLRRRALASPFQYVSFPNFMRIEDPETVHHAITDAIRRGLNKGYVPILSNEGWCTWPDHFARILADLGNPPTDIVCYVRPPTDWINSAYWQWGLWSHQNLGRWLDQGNIRYNFHEKLPAFAAIPNVRLRVQRPQPDVVAKFAGLYGLKVPAVGTANGTAPTSLIGLVQRNRAPFRPSPLDPSIEFIFSRWCPMPDEPRPWAMSARHVVDLRPVLNSARARFEQLLAPEDFSDLMQDPRWHSEEPYHERMRQGLSDLKDISLMPGLYAALAEGVAKAEGRAGRAGHIPHAPDAATLEAWDAACSALLLRIKAADARVRRRETLLGA
ncbi:MAG: hypothetical protein AAGM84_06515 [Pseudomonadota bacterium]